MLMAYTYKKMVGYELKGCFREVEDATNYTFAVRANSPSSCMMISIML